jgi:protein LTV1
MQNIPDSLRGFQPDMDPDLREVLEILEDDLPQPPSTENSDNEDPEDIFAQLVQSGERPVHETSPLDADEFSDNEYEGYESDDTIKAGIQGSEYLKEMSQWKTVPTQDMNTKILDKEDVNSMGGDDSVVGGETESMFSRTSNANTHRTSKQRRRRRQRLGGAYSEAGTDYSMTSSANFRNEGLTSLDDRFDKVFDPENLSFLSLSMDTCLPSLAYLFNPVRQSFLLGRVQFTLIPLPCFLRLTLP